MKKIIGYLILVLMLSSYIIALGILTKIWWVGLATAIGAFILYGLVFLAAILITSDDD